MMASSAKKAAEPRAEAAVEGDKGEKTIGEQGRSKRRDGKKRGEKKRARIKTLLVFPVENLFHSFRPLLLPFLAYPFL